MSTRHACDAQTYMQVTPTPTHTHIFNLKIKMCIILCVSHQMDSETPVFFLFLSSSSFIFKLFETSFFFFSSSSSIALVVHYIDKADLELTEIHLLLSSKCWD